MEKLAFVSAYVPSLSLGLVLQLVGALALADLAYVIYRNRSALAFVFSAGKSTAVNQLLPVPVAFGVLSFGMDLVKAWLGVGQTVAAQTGGVLAAVLGFVPAFLNALANPVAAALVFLLIGGGAGWLKGSEHGYRNGDKAGRAAMVDSANGVVDSVVNAAKGLPATNKVAADVSRAVSARIDAARAECKAPPVKPKK